MSQARDWEAEKAQFNEVPYWNILGIKVEEMAEGYARVAVPIEPRMNNKEGALHGGVLSALSDTAVGVAMYTVIEPGERPVTVELNINYLKPVESDQAIAEARIVSRGRTIAVGDVDVTDKSGRLIAKSRVTYR